MTSNDTPTPSLLDPFDLAGLRLPNRIVMSPMARVRSNASGLATTSMAAYYAQRATAGLIITEGTQPSLLGQSSPLTPGLYTDAQAESWKQVTTAVHANGGRIFAQIMHSGRVSHPDTTGLRPVGPSAIAPREAMVFTPTGPQPVPLPRALAIGEVSAEAASYAAAASRAISAGFDGVELHGANGYLIGQFLSSSANQRTDHYGGSITGRIRFAVEAVEATVDAIGGRRVGIRLSPGGFGRESRRQIGANLDDRSWLGASSLMKNDDARGLAFGWVLCWQGWLMPRMSKAQACPSEP